MAVVLDLADIQGNILTAYGKQGFPKGRCITLNVSEAAKARRFVTELLPKITTALRWKARRSEAPVGEHEVTRPAVAVNIAFTWCGLLALGVPTRTLRGMPDEFIDGMMNRASMLGDNFNQIDPMKTWDTVWTAAEGYRTVNSNIVHILITLNAQMNPDGSPVRELDTVTKYIEDLCAKTGGVRILPGHSQPDEKEPAKYQDLTAITYSLPDGTVVPSPKEHFDFTDGIGDPIFEGQYPGRHEQRVAQGNGAVDGTGKWRPLATGEFLLGYPDEAQEIPGSTMPLDFSRNGTFMAYRKLHQNVVAFRSFIAGTAERFGAVFGINNPQEARDALMAKIAGRWPDGVPVARAPTVEDWKKFNVQYPDVPPSKDRKAYLARQQAFIDFTYADDMGGLKCPLTSHVRRTNTRDGLAPTGRGRLGAEQPPPHHPARLALRQFRARRPRFRRTRHHHAGGLREPVPAV